MFQSLLRAIPASDVRMDQWRCHKTVVPIPSSGSASFWLRTSSIAWEAGKYYTLREAAHNRPFLPENRVMFRGMWYSSCLERHARGSAQRCRHTCLSRKRLLIFPPMPEQFSFGLRLPSVAMMKEVFLAALGITPTVGAYSLPVLYNKMHWWMW